MTNMEAVETFKNELQSLVEIKPPVSKAKMGLITRAAMKGVKFYKHIVQGVEIFISKCSPEYKIPGLYVIDSIVRQSRHQFGERDVYAPRFSRNLQSTFSNLFVGCSADDKPKIVRVLNLWQKNRVFTSKVIQPLLDMADPNSLANLPSEPSLSGDSPTNFDSKQGQSSKYLMNRFSGQANNSQFSKSSSSSGKHRVSDSGVAGGIKFNKNMLDFDYDEDDDDDGDETPTEAEPPLSSTLSKIEMEQRGRNDLSTSSYKSSQLHQQSGNQLNMRNEDPVLARWKGLLNNQSITSENSNNNDYQSVDRHQRHRSRSPPPRPLEKHTPPKKEVYVSQKIATAKPSINSAEKEAERARKSLPPIKDKHLTVCSSTLWLGHVPKGVTEADISNAFGEFGTINSIDLIPPRGCAYVCMDRRQDAKRALSESKDLKLNGNHIKMAWAPGKGFKEYKKFKDFWEVSTGSSYIPYGKIDASIDFDILEEGGVIDEDSMSMEMREIRERKAKDKDNKANNTPQTGLSLPLPALPILTQPPPFAIPPPNLSIPPPAILSQAPGLGGIPFPPPPVTTTAPMPVQPPPLFDGQESQDQDSMEGLNSPTTIDQKLSMTERQINMVEQQLSMIQQAQGISHSQPTLQQNYPQAIYQQTQPNPMMFDLSAQMLHVAPHLVDQQQIPIFANPPPHFMEHPPQMLSTGQAHFNPSMNGSTMSNYDDRF